MLNAGILIVALAAGAVLMLPRVARDQLWRATITPLASIIGSGFLVLGPILDQSYGRYAPLVMAALCAIAWLFGSAIRFNIAAIDRGAARGRAIERLESISAWALAFAYIISVAYYLNLLGAFAVSLTAMDDALHARLVTTGAFALILITGWTSGFRALERMEQVSVGIKLAVICGLLFGLAVFFVDRVRDGGLLLNPPTLSSWAAITLAFGLIVTVQGFETSRYLGKTYDAPTRIRSMKLAQWVSTAIYMAYICVLAFVFAPGTLSHKETAIIGMMEIVAPVLPALLVAAALSAQFSAAVADTGGSGGLIEELTGGRIRQRHAYAVLVVLGLGLTWAANIFQIISYASRAFAAYYALQAAIAALGAWPASRTRATGFAALAALGMAITVLGTPAE